MSKKPKFREGQVVAVKQGYLHQHSYHRICGSRMGKDNLEYWNWQGDFFAEFTLRALTGWEIGKRKASGK